MLRKGHLKYFLVLLTAAMFLDGCGGGQVKAKPDLKDPIAQVSALEKEMTEARENQLHVLAPDAFAKAEAFLKKAQKKLAREEELSEINLAITSARVHLRLAEDAGEVARNVLTDVITARDLARKAGAEKLGDDYREAEKEFLKLTRAIENNDLRWAKENETRVTEAYDRLELQAIKEQNLGSARDLLAQAEKMGAEKSAPAALAEARHARQKADEFITKNRYESAGIRREADEALFQAERLVQILQAGEKIRSMKPEQVAIWMEGLLHRATVALGAADLRDQSFETQAANIVDGIGALEQKNQALVGELANVRSELAAQEDQIANLQSMSKEDQAERERLAGEEQAARERLAQERMVQQLFDKVQNYFDEGEAEVYRQGQHLLIRLKGIDFPVGKGFILPENYPLLAKLQRAIRTFGDPEVVIEGHTDSTGTREINAKLSRARAESVRKYLVANETLPAEKIVAVGYGPDRPIAPNETPEGRALNRRIDVVITPSP